MIIVTYAVIDDTFLAALSSRSLFTLFLFRRFNLLHSLRCDVSAFTSAVLPLELHLTTSELWFGQEQEAILP